MLAIDERLETALFSYPVRAGWVDSDGITLVPGLQASQAKQATVALLDAIVALGMLETHAIVRDAAIACRVDSMVTLTTPARPDEVDNVTLVVTGTAPASRALAQALLQPFYGITVREWSEEPRPVGPGVAVLADGPAGLRGPTDEAHYQEDLGHAWYLLAQRPFVSHVAVVPRALLVRDPATARAAVERLLAIRAAGEERARELRRDLAKTHAIDRELLVEVLADQTYTLGDEELEGLAELARRAGLPVTLRQLQQQAVRLLPAGNE